MKGFEFKCPQCPTVFLSDAARYGHIGSVHSGRVRELKPIEHGTTRGYRAHKRREEHACPECLRAWRKEYQRKFKA